MHPSWRVSVHDCSHFELIFEYDIPKSEISTGNYRKRKKQPPSHYEISYYCFFPKSMGLSNEFHSAREIHAANRQHYRLSMPDEDLAGAELFTNFRRYIGADNNILKKQRVAEACVYEQKMFANLMQSLCHNTKNEDTLKTSKNIEELLFSFRKTYRSIDKLSANFFLEDFENFPKAIDEFISNEFCAFLERSLAEKACNDLKCVFLKELNYRKLNFKTYKFENSDIDRARFVSRKSDLKKLVATSLYLKHKKNNRDRMASNAGAAVAAGVAALFANLVQLNSQLSIGASNLGFQAYSMLSIAVIAYVFKDRIKDLGKEYLNKKLKHYLPDFDTTLQSVLPNSKGQMETHSVFDIKEEVSILRPKDLPDEIRYFRALILKDKPGRTQGEVVYKNKKRIYFPFKSGLIYQSNFTKIKDIMRFNTKKFMENLDDAVRGEKHLSGFENLTTMKFPKNYFFDVVIKSTSTSVNYENNKNEHRLNAFRVYLNRDQIIGVSPKLSDLNFRYKEDPV